MVCTYVLVPAQILELRPMAEIEGKSFLSGYENSTILMMCEVKDGTEPFVTAINLNTQVVQHVPVSTRNISYTLTLEPMHHLKELECSATNDAGKSSTRSSIFVLCKYFLLIFFRNIIEFVLISVKRIEKKQFPQDLYDFVTNTV